MIPLKPILKQLHPDIIRNLGFDRDRLRDRLREHHPGSWYLTGRFDSEFGYHLVFPTFEEEVMWKLANIGALSYE